jgi:hypothetical protein
MVSNQLIKGGAKLEGGILIKIFYESHELLLRNDVTE